MLEVEAVVEKIFIIGYVLFVCWVIEGHHLEFGNTTNGFVVLFSY